MRVIAGSLRGRRLAVLAGERVRPTSDRVREALFNLLGPGTPGLRVLDLFAGSGALAIEALSRGAEQAWLVESDRRALAVLRRNIESCGLADRTRVLPARVERFLTGAPPRPGFDLVLADPPYRQGWPERLLELLGGGQWLEPGGRLVVESEAELAPPQQAGRLALAKSRTYGTSALHIFLEGTYLR